MARGITSQPVKVEKLSQIRKEELRLSSQLERKRVLYALRTAGLLAEPTLEMRRHAKEYDARHSPAEQEQLLAELRNLHLKPSLSQTILQNRE